MVVCICKEDQDKVTCVIERIERELQDLCALLGDIAHRSKEKGFLEVGDTIKIVKTGIPDSPSVVRRAVVILLDYRIHNLRVKKVQEGVSSNGAVVMVTDLDMKEHSIRRVEPGNGNDESDGSISYNDEEDYVDTD